MNSLVLAQHVPGAEALLFYLFAGAAAASALGVVLSQNIVRMAVCLLFALGSVAGIYLLLAAEFLAALQLVVYVGGTLILIVFGILLTSKSPFVRLRPSVLEVVLAVALGTVLLTALVTGILRTQFADNPMYTEDLYPVHKLGQVLLGDYLVPFEMASVVLLVVMIGAAFLAKARRGNRP